MPIVQRNMDASRDQATELPRSEGDQAIVDGWPLYRTERGQRAFNDAMATLAATEGKPPAASAFKTCIRLACRLRVPGIRDSGWLAPGRYWVSPSEYVLLVHSPRHSDGESYRRHSPPSMRYFVFHEFHNGTRNTDTYDTISSHSGSVFVPLYLSKEQSDGRGRRFVVVVQVAPYDVVSAHAANLGSAGPGIEVAKNVSDELEPLQAVAGILVATMVRIAAPHLEFVNHRGSEGQPSLEAFEERRARLGEGDAPAMLVPYVKAKPERVASVAARLGELIRLPGSSPPIPVAERGFMPRRSGNATTARRIMAASQQARVGATAGDTDLPEPQLIGPIRPAIRPATLRRGAAPPGE